MFTDWYKNSQNKRSTDAVIAEELEIKPGSKPLSFPTKYAASGSTQRKAHLKRAYKQYWRSSNYNFARIMIGQCSGLRYCSMLPVYVSTQLQCCASAVTLDVVTRECSRLLSCRTASYTLR